MPTKNHDQHRKTHVRPGIRRWGICFALLFAPVFAAGSDLAEDVLDALIVPGQPYSSVALSPDGNRVAYGRTMDGRLTLSVLELATNDVSSFDVTDSEKDDPSEIVRFVRRSIDAFTGWWGVRRSGGADPSELFIDYIEWPANDRIIYRVSDGELFGVDPDGANRMKYLQFDIVKGVRAHSLDTISIADEINLLPEDPDHIMVGGIVAQLGANPVLPGGEVLSSYFGVNIRDGRSFEVANAERIDGAVLVDQFGIVRGSHRSAFQHGWSQIRLHDGEKDSIQPLDEIFGSEALEDYGLRVREFSDFWVGGTPFGFGFNPDVMFFAAPYERDTNAVFAADIRNREILGPIFEVEGFDVTSQFDLRARGCLVFVPEKKNVGGFRYEDIAERTVWRIPEFARVQATLDQSLPERVNRIFDWDQSLRKFLVHSFAASDPGAVFLLDRSTKRLQRIVELLPGLDRSRLGATVPLWVDTRDGRRILCYFTQPRGGGDTPPLIVLLDTRRCERSTFSFDEAVQYFAANGYAVLQVNHRGVRGFGLSHLNAARGDYVDVALQDVEDALNWMANRELYDPQRVFAAGTSIGGILALSMAARNPEAFRAVLCLDTYTDPTGIRFSSMDDVFDWMAADPKRSTAEDSRRNNHALRRMSPYHHAASINTPVFLIGYSGNVSIGLSTSAFQARKMHAVLQSNDVETELRIIGEEEMNTREELKAPILAMMSFLNEHDLGAEE